MSNRNHPQGRPDGGSKALAKAQRRFIPKSHDSAPKDGPNPNPTLSRSLRQSLTQQSSSAASSLASNSRVRLGENGDWVSSSPSGGRFVNYLPQDEAVAAGLGAEDGGLDPVESQRVVDLLNRELSRLLKLNPRNFWKEVYSDASLHDFIDSFLQFRSRWYDFPHRGAKETVAGVIVGEFELCRRVFMLLYRLSSSKDPGLKPGDSLKPKDHAALLQEKKLLDLPKLLDTCAVYGHENQDLTMSLVCNALESQPGITNDLTALICHFMNIVHTMHQRCDSSLEALPSSTGHVQHRSAQLLQDLLEVMDFTNDAVVSMDAFVSAYKSAAVFFSCPVEMSYGNEELLRTLASLHDSLLPSLQRGFQKLFTSTEGLHNTSSDMHTNVALSLKMLSLRIVKFGWKLLEICYLSAKVFDGSFALPAVTKMFPANVEDPFVRGDILVQTFRDIGGGVTDVQKDPWERFLQNVEKYCHIMSRLENLRDTGWIILDDEQINYLCNLMVVPSRTSYKGSLSAATPVTTNESQSDEDAAVMESKVSQIRELFPDYGKGFLSACLEVYNHNPEEVIQRILEGTLHEDLQSLDTSLDKVPEPKVCSSLSTNDKGKGKISEFTTLPAASMTDGRKQPTQGPLLSSSTVGRFVRKPKKDLPNLKILDSRDERDAEKTAALVSQFEYEDEYDDSFDELGLSIVESGLEETEILGDRVSSNLSMGTEGHAQHSSNNSKWGSRKKPQFFVKDGKNYSYKVAGSIAAANQNEASLIIHSQKEIIHGLGHGGNLPLGAVKRLKELTEEQNDLPEDTEVAGRGNPGGSRGRGRRGRNTYRKDQALRKHMSGLRGN